MYDDDDDGPSRFGSYIRLLCIVLVGVVGGFAIRPLVASDDTPSADATVQNPSSTTTFGPALSTSEFGDATTPRATDTTEAVATTEAVTTTTQAATTTEATTTTAATTTTEAVPTTEAVATTELPENTEFQLTNMAAMREWPEATEIAETTEPPATTEVPTTTDAPATTDASETTEPATSAPATTETGPSPVAIPYDTMPDGSPEPVVITFDSDAVTLEGAVPSDEAVAFLTAYAAANSQNPDARIRNRLVVNPAVPIGVGVRVIELESPRFLAGSASISADHARQLNRVAGVMQAMPQVTVVVVGHADQRGSEATNLDLSQQRAESVIAYLADLGVEGSRMSARAVGEADLLSVGEDSSSLALNRRTEFIFYGVLLTDPTTLTTND